ncbi:hypothetical protein [Natrialba taiwanensis]|uniref:Uncharacterized protein n=1 Tax=Natrialba taiwanensis DSM 12281 TaxID=1230458 RepID=M0AG48_9EURY|nr:hypothetical protein [Natrialba taiwanensis]ELY96333.1 hypothetical protein C484_01425 [Natrialba taiwanensis DSM 12281]
MMRYQFEVPVAHRRLQFVRGQLAWMLALVIALSAVSLFSYELFFVGSLLGLLLIVELTAPVTVRPRWRRRLMWVVLIGFVAFILAVGYRFVEVLPPEVIPW